MNFSSPPDTLPLFANVLRMTVQASVVIVLILTFQRLLGRRLPPAWRHALWSLVVLRLLLPVFPESRLSLFNLDFSVKSVAVEQPETPTAVATQVAASPPVATSIPRAKELPPPVSPPTPPVELTTSVSTTSPEQLTPAAISRLRAWQLAAVLWLLGILFLAFRTAHASLRLSRRLRRGGPATDHELLQVANECRRQLGMTRLPRLVIVPSGSEPGIVGLFRPTVMIPQSLLAPSARIDLQHVLLHELVHLTRGDLLWNWLGLLACHLHWFNPLVWFAARRARFDAELACDAHALANLPPQQRLSYGETLLQLLEQSTTPPRMRPAVPLLAHRNDLHRRITMIAGYEGPSYRGTLCGLAAITMLCLLGLTQAVGETPPTTPQQETAAGIAPKSTRTTPATKPATPATKSVATQPGEKAAEPTAADVTLKEYLQYYSRQSLIVPEIRHLRRDERVQYVRFRGPKITDRDLEELAHHPEIQNISLQDVAKVRGPGLQFLTRLPNLTSLEFLGAACTDDLVLSTPQLPKLTKLTLVSCGTSGKSLQILEHCPNLQELELRSVAADSGMENLRHVPKLTRLSLVKNDLSDAGMKHLAQVSELQWLYLDGPAAVTDAGLESLKNLTDLETFDFREFSIKGPGLANLAGAKRIKAIQLYSKSMNDDWVVALPLLSSIERLSLLGTNVTCKKLEKLRDWHHLSQLNLYGTGKTLKEDDIKSLSELIQLRQLMIPAVDDPKSRQKLQEALPNTLLM